MSTQYWEEEIEIMSREKLQELQLQLRGIMHEKYFK